MTEVENGNTPPKNGLDGAGFTMSALPEGKGSYVLLMELPRTETIAVGHLEAVHFNRGYYAYVGSAMGGFRARLGRHLRVNKRPHWHIDYLLQKASINDIVTCPTDDTVECIIAQALSRHFGAIPGFGSSDCHCPSHLFFATDGKQLESAVISVTRRISPQGRQVMKRKR